MGIFVALILCWMTNSLAAHEMCSPVKVVGGCTYTLLEVTSTLTECNTKCVYTTKEGGRFCFRVDDAIALCDVKDGILLFGGKAPFEEVSRSVDGTCNVGSYETPVVLQHARAAIKGDRIYICGGRESDAEYYDKCYIRDRTSDWHGIGPTMKRKRNIFTLSVVGEKLVAVGGRNATGVYQETVEVLDFKEEVPAWKLQSYTISPARDNHCAVTVSSTSIMLIGGYNPGPGDLKITEELDVETGSLKKYPELPVTLVWHACVLYQNKIYTTGGNADGKPTNAVFTLDFSVHGSVWMTAPSMIKERSSHAMGVLNGVPSVFSGNEFGWGWMEVLVNGEWLERQTFKRSESAYVVIQC